MNKHAVILGAGENGLGAVRSLKRANVPTILVAFNQRDPALLSRYPKRKVLVRCNENLDEPLLAQLETIRYEHPVLIPTADVFVSFIVRHRTRLNSRFCFCLPHDGLIESLLDKSREVKLISDQGVSIPNTFVDLSQHTPSRVQELGFPMIVKPKSWVEVQELGAKNAIIHSQKELISFLGRHSSILPGLLAQEIIPGDDSNQWVCNCTFGRNHELACAFTFRRLRLGPAHRGVTSYAVSESNEAILSLAGKIGKALRYVGPAMIEFKYDTRDRRYKYLELNPRIGLCNYFDTSCGVNNVYQAYLLAGGHELANSDHRQQDNVMYLSLYNDMYSRIKDGESLYTILRHYLKNIQRRHVGAYLAWDDPFPAIIMGWRQWSFVCVNVVRRLLMRAKSCLFVGRRAGDREVRRRLSEANRWRQTP